MAGAEIVTRRLAGGERGGQVVHVQEGLSYLRMMRNKSAGRDFSIGPEITFIGFDEYKLRQHYYLGEIYVLVGLPDEEVSDLLGMS